MNYSNIDFKTFSEYQEFRSAILNTSRLVQIDYIPKYETLPCITEWFIDTHTKEIYCLARGDGPLVPYWQKEFVPVEEYS